MKKRRYLDMTRSFDFPKKLYVQEPMAHEEELAAHLTCEAAEDGDIIGVYELKSVARVKHQTNVLLEDL